MQLRIRVVFKGKPAHKILINVKFDGDTSDEAFVGFVTWSGEGAQRVILDGYSFIMSDVLYFELVNFEPNKN